MPISPRSSTRPTNGSSSAAGIRQRHIAADDELTSTLGIAAAHQALVRAGDRSGRHRSRDLRHRYARPHLPGDRRQDPGRSRRDQRRGFRHPGRLLGLRLRHDDRRQLPEDRAVQARLRHRRRDLLAHSRLVRSLDLRALRRRRRRRRARGPAAARHERRSRHPRHAHPLRRPLRGSALCRRRSGLDQDRRTFAHERPRGVPPRRAEDFRRHRGDARHDRLSRPTRSISTFRIRRTRASSTASPRSSASIRRRSS